jgi:hypothetical protein
VRLKILWFIIKTLFLGYGRGTMQVKERSGVNVSYNITDDKGNYELLIFKTGNNYE